MAEWAVGNVALHYIAPGEPWRNGDVESFNARIRDECLNINSFWSLAHARVVISDRKHDYDHHRRTPPSATNPRLATPLAASTAERSISHPANSADSTHAVRDEK